MDTQGISEPTEKLSAARVKALAPPESGNRIYYDGTGEGAVRGFGLRITAAGARAFILTYRIRGRQRRYTIGDWPSWTVVAARDEAKRLKREISLGRDPMGDKDAERGAPTVADLCDRYVEQHLPKKRPTSRRDDHAMIDKIVKPKLGNLKVAAVRHADIDGLHRSLKATPYRANRVISMLSKLMNLAVKWDLRTDNPVRGIEKYPEERRERYLSTFEIARLTNALAAHSNQTAANAIRFLMLTGARRGEVLRATWSQFNIEDGVWTKPSSHTKQKKEHRIPLSAPALELLVKIKERSDGEFVFAGKAPDQPLKDLKSSWASICKAAELEGVRVHDLRHTYASILASAGLSLLIIGRLLGHTQPGTTSRYAHLADDPLREATERVGAVVTSAGDSGAQIVPIKGGAA